MRRTDDDLLHGPWDTTEAPDDAELHSLQHDYGHRWRIWRGITENRVLGDWHAMLTDPPGALRGVRSTSAQGLRRCLSEAESER